MSDTIALPTAETPKQRHADVDDEESGQTITRKQSTVGSVRVGGSPPSTAAAPSTPVKANPSAASSAPTSAESDSTPTAAPASDATLAEMLAAEVAALKAKLEQALAQAAAPAPAPTKKRKTPAKATAATTAKQMTLSMATVTAAAATAAVPAAASAMSDAAAPAAAAAVIVIDDSAVASVPLSDFASDSNPSESAAAAAFSAAGASALPASPATPAAKKQKLKAAGSSTKETPEQKAARKAAELAAKEAKKAAELEAKEAKKREAEAKKKEEADRKAEAKREAEEKKAEQKRKVEAEKAAAAEIKAAKAAEAAAHKAELEKKKTTVHASKALFSSFFGIKPAAPAAPAPAAAATAATPAAATNAIGSDATTAVAPSDTASAVTPAAAVTAPVEKAEKIEPFFLPWSPSIDTGRTWAPVRRERPAGEVDRFASAEWISDPARIAEAKRRAALRASRGCFQAQSYSRRKKLIQHYDSSRSEKKNTFWGVFKKTLVPPATLLGATTASGATSAAASDAASLAHAALVAAANASASAIRPLRLSHLKWPGVSPFALNYSYDSEEERSLASDDSDGDDDPEERRQRDEEKARKSKLRKDGLADDSDSDMDFMAPEDDDPLRDATGAAGSKSARAGIALRAEWVGPLRCMDTLASDPAVLESIAQLRRQIQQAERNGTTLTINDEQKKLLQIEELMMYKKRGQTENNSEKQPSATGQRLTRVVVPAHSLPRCLVVIALCPVYPTEFDTSSNWSLAQAALPPLPPIVPIVRRKKKTIAPTAVTPAAAGSASAPASAASAATSSSAPLKVESAESPAAAPATPAPAVPLATAAAAAPVEVAAKPDAPSPMEMDE